jgi:hypothetical protein
MHQAKQALASRCHSSNVLKGLAFVHFQIDRVRVNKPESVTAKIFELTAAYSYE